MAATATPTDLEPEIFVPSEWGERFIQTEEKFCREIRKIEPRALLSLLTSLCQASYNCVRPYLDRYQQPTILEVGSGYGFDLCYLRKMGLDAHGIEPGANLGFEGRYDQAVELLEANGIAEARQILHQGRGESLPFEDETFDIVYSVSVLEHVQDIKQCVTEALRVVKPGGVVVMSVPTYNSFKEDHYNILWLPYLLKSKRLAKWYVRTIYKRSDWFIDELNFITPRLFKKLARQTPQLKGMKLYLHINPHVPILRGIFGRAREAHYRLSDKAAESAEPLSFKDRLLRRGTGYALSLGELLGMGMFCHLVWEKKRAD